MFPNLRLKLVLAFTVVTMVTVFLAGAMMMFLLRERETEAARERVGLLGNMVAEQVSTLARNSWQADTLSYFLQQRAEQLHLRFLLIDSKNTIITDTDGRLTGQSSDVVTEDNHEFRDNSLAGYRFTTWQGQVVFIPSVGRRLQVVAYDYRLLMLVPEADITGAWKDLLPRLGAAGGIALFAAVIVAVILARSITRPVLLVTRGSEKMARGDYQQTIPVQGHDEIARMACTFNQMAQQVARTHQAMHDLNANVAHELKTPLTSIQGYSQALLDGLINTPEDTNHAAHVIYDESERMRRLVEDLLYLSRLESGQLKLERTTIHVPTLVEQAAERVAFRVREKGQRLQVQMGIDIPQIQGDEHRLAQVMANLLENAIRHTPAEGVITIGVHWTLAHVTISVHNTGSYIALEHQQRIFERFYQVDASRVRDGHRGGLGLAIVKEIVAAHDGRLSVTSDPNEGTTFSVVLPTDVGRTTPNRTPRETGAGNRESRTALARG